MVLKLTVTRVGTLPLTFETIVQNKFITAKNASVAIGAKTRDMMRHKITESLVRDGSTGNLANSINFFVEPDGTVGVGSIEELNFRAPYWYLMNFGGFAAIAARRITLFGSFSGVTTGNPIPSGKFAGTTPVGGGIVKDRFFPGIFNYPMAPKFPVAPKNYIEKTVSWLATVWRIHYSGYLNRITIKTK